MPENPARHIGVVVNPLISFGRAIMWGVARYALEARNWVLDDTSGVPYLPHGVIRKWRGDGLIGEIKPPLARVINQRGIAFVNISSVPRMSPGPSVIIDNEAVGRLAAEHLMGKGLRRLAITVMRFWPHMYVRARAFARCAAAEGLAATVIQMPRINLQPGIEGFGCEKMKHFLRRQGEPVGVFASNDLMARTVIGAARELGLRVPEDVAVLGEGNWDFICDVVEPRMSSIDIGADRIGYRAARLLDELMSGGKVPGEPILILPKSIVQRESTDLLAIDDDVVRDSLRFIADHSHVPIQVSDVLRAVPVSRRVLESRFRRVLGRTVYEEIRRAHIRLACRLVTESSIPIKRVSLACGYVSAGRFREAFRRETGLTPSHYRGQHRYDSPREMAVRAGAYIRPGA